MTQKIQSKQEIENVLNDFVNAHESKDIDKLMNLIANEDIILYGTSQNEKYLNKEPLRDATVTMFKQIDTIKIEMPWYDVKISEPVAWVNVDFIFIFNASKPEAKSVDARSTMILKQIANEWKIVCCHLSLPAKEEPYES
jgi:ketosteroid isomerase-like protein